MIKIQVQINGVSALVDRNMLPLDKDGREITKVLDEIVDGKYVVDSEALAIELEEQKLKEFKIVKDKALKQIVVTTENGNAFDGNETARTNMLSEIMSLEIVGIVETEWKLADDNAKLISLDELKEALSLAIQEVGRIVKSKTIEELEV